MDHNNKGGHAGHDAHKQKHGQAGHEQGHQKQGHQSDHQGHKEHGKGDWCASCNSKKSECGCK